MNAPERSCKELEAEIAELTTQRKHLIGQKNEARESAKRWHEMADQLRKEVELLEAYVRADRKDAQRARDEGPEAAASYCYSKAVCR